MFLALSAWNLSNVFERNASSSASRSNGMTSLPLSSTLCAGRAATQGTMPPAPAPAAAIATPAPNPAVESPAPAPCSGVGHPEDPGAAQALPAEHEVEGPEDATRADAGGLSAPAEAEVEGAPRPRRRLQTELRRFHVRDSHSSSSARPRGERNRQVRRTDGGIESRPHRGSGDGGFPGEGRGGYVTTATWSLRGLGSPLCSSWLRPWASAWAIPCLPSAAATRACWGFQRRVRRGSGKGRNRIRSWFSICAHRSDAHLSVEPKRAAGDPAHKRDAERGVAICREELLYVLHLYKISSLIESITERERRFTNTGVRALASAQCTQLLASVLPAGLADEFRGRRVGWSFCAAAPLDERRGGFSASAGVCSAGATGAVAHGRTYIKHGWA